MLALTMPTPTSDHFAGLTYHTDHTRELCVSHLFCLPLPDQLKTAGIFPKPSRYGYMTDILSHNVALAEGYRWAKWTGVGS